MTALCPFDLLAEDWVKFRVIVVCLLSCSAKCLGAVSCRPSAFLCWGGGGGLAKDLAGVVRHVLILFGAVAGAGGGGGGASRVETP